MSSLRALHPHEEFSAVLSFLYCFGLPPFLERDIEKAILFAREGAFTAACGRCFTLLGFLLSISFPPLLGASHVAHAKGFPLFFTDLEMPLPTARLPRDVGLWDAAAVAYAKGSEHLDVFGVLASNYLTASKQFRSDFQAPRPFGVLSRVPHHHVPHSETCLKNNALGQVAAEIVEDLANRSWSHLPSPLSSLKEDLSWLQYVLADPNRASEEDLMAAASLLERNDVDFTALAPTARRHSATELFRLAAERGDAEAALRQAVEAESSSKRFFQAK